MSLEATTYKLFAVLEASEAALEAALATLIMLLASEAALEARAASLFAADTKLVMLDEG